MCSKNPRIRTITSKNLQLKIWELQEMKVVSQVVFSVILPEPVENGWSDKFSLISTKAMDGMFIYLPYQLGTKPG